MLLIRKFGRVPNFFNSSLVLVGQKRLVPPLNPCFQIAGGCPNRHKTTTIQERDVGKMLAKPTPRAIFSYEINDKCRRSDSN